MTARLVVALVVIASAYARINAVLFGQPVSVPVLGLVAVAVVLALAITVLVLIRTIVRDSGLFLRPRVVKL